MRDLRAKKAPIHIGPGYTLWQPLELLAGECE
jgi:hypothetical protein